MYRSNSLLFCLAVTMENFFIAEGYTPLYIQSWAEPAYRPD